MPQQALIVGAGLAGSLLAIELARLGMRVLIVERRPDPRAAGFVGGRSINLALSTRGITALQRVGLAERVLADAVRMRGRMMHPAPAMPAGSPASAPPPIFQPYSKDPADAIQSVSRGGLNLTLIEAAAAEPGVEFRFNLRCTHVDLERPAATFENPAGAHHTIEADLIFGADGAFSAVRSAMQITDRFDYSQIYLPHGYKELHIPPAAEIPGGPGAGGRDGFAIEPNALHIWPRGGSMMIALPNADRSFTCTLFWPFEGDHGFSAIDPENPEQIRAFFDRHYPDAPPLMPTLVEDYQRNPTSSLVTIRCNPWHTGGKVLILGDAAHAIVPFFGQGMNAAFEDVRILAEMLTEAGAAKTFPDTRDIFPAFTAARKPHADAIADMALDNFIEMRDKVGRPDFLYHKRVEQALHALYPDRAVPLYNLISFTNTPYAKAQRQGQALDATVREITRRLTRTEAESLDDATWRAAIADLARNTMPEAPVH